MGETKELDLDTKIIIKKLESREGLDPVVLKAAVIEFLAEESNFKLIKEAEKKYYAAMFKVCELSNEGFMFQAPDLSDTVFKVQRPKGRYITYPEAGIGRTRRADEKDKNTGVTLTEAKEIGFEVA